MIGRASGRFPQAFQRRRPVHPRPNVESRCGFGFGDFSNSFKFQRLSPTSAADYLSVPARSRTVVADLPMGLEGDDRIYAEDQG
jgi:hypothetical protein